MPSVQDEHSSEHSQAFQGLLNSYSLDDSADEFPERSPLQHSGHRPLGIGHIVQVFPFDMLTQVNTFRLRCSGIFVSGAVLALTTLSLRDFIVVPPLVQEGRRRSHMRRGNTFTSSPSYHHSSFSSFRERDRKWYKSKEETH